MNKELFIQDLRRFLADLPEEEQNAAIQYYEDYFNDAGPEREQEVIKELGSPVDIARQIKRTNQDSILYGEGSAPNRDAAYPLPNRTSSAENREQYTGGESQGQGAYAQGGQTAGPKNNNWNNSSAGAGTAGNWSNATAGANGAGTWNNAAAGRNGAANHSSNTAGKTILIVLLCIFAIPVGIPVLCTIFALLITLISLIAALIITLFATGGALFVSGIITIACSFALFPTGSIANILLGLGSGFILLSLGGWIVWAGVLLCGKALPALCHGVWHGIKTIRKGGN